MTQYCLDVLNRKNDTGVINRTSIVLISKISEPSDIMQFWSTSLCNVIYKMTFKVLVNRFRKVLDRYIDEGQAAFILGGQITDNVLIV